MRSRFILLLVFSLLVSCSGKAPSKAKFQIEMGQFALVATGGLTLYGKSTSGDKFARVITGTTTVTEELPIGTWSFGALAWEGTDPFTGTIKCGSQSNVVVSGDSVVVNLILNNANCFNSGFSSETGQGSSPNLTASGIFPQFCEGDVSGLINPCTYSPTVATSPRRGFVGSYRVLIPGARVFGGKLEKLPENLLSQCFTAGTNQNQTTSDFVSTLNIPAFNPGTAPLNIVAYLGDNCQESQGSMVLSLTDPTRMRFYQVSGSSKYLYARTPLNGICSISDMMATTSFASGAGSSDFPYVICNEKQLKYLQNNMDQTPIHSASYILGRDINLLPLINAGSATATTAFDSNCTDLGDTFAPIGLKLDGGCNANNYALTGNFDGNDFTIAHLRMKRGGEDNVGLFRTTSGTISNLKLSRAAIEGRDYVGAFVGSGSGTLHNLKIGDSYIEGDRYVGGVIGGALTTSTITQIIGDKVNVEAESQVGGLFGTVIGSVSDVSFNGSINVDDSNAMYVGGVLGDGISATIENAVSSGVMSFKGAYVGGIVGKTASLDFSRSDMLLKDHDSAGSNRYIGGLAGFLTGSTASSLFHGHVQTSCMSPGCFIGDISGSSSGVSDTFSTQTLSGLGGASGLATYDLSDVFFGDAVKDALCAGSDPCAWSQISGDKPRLAFESTHLCANPTYNSSFAAQSGRGTEASPYIICNQTQFADIPSYSSSTYFELAQNINASSFSAGGIGSLQGQLNGNGYSVIAHVTEFSNISNHLFSSILSGASVRNLTLSGFSYYDSSCLNCKKSPLALINNGTIFNVHVSGLFIDTSDSSSQLSGLVNVNNGVISHSEVWGNLRGTHSLGGFAFKNNGRISNVTSNIELDGKYGSGTNFGGIAAVNNKLIERSRFKGKMDYLNGSSMIGGIAGSLEYFGGAYYPKLQDNVVTKDANINLGSGTNTTGGIFGYSDNAGNQVVRNIMSGFMLEPTADPSINPIDGAGGFVNTNNHALTSTYQVLDMVMSSISTSYAAGVCSITLLGAVDDNTVTFGAVRLDYDYYYGPLSRDAMNTYTLNAVTDAGRCSDLGSVDLSSSELYKAHASPDTGVTVATLKAEGYNIVDMQVPAEASLVFDAHISFMRGIYPSNPPVWIYEPGEDDPIDVFHLD